MLVFFTEKKTGIRLISARQAEKELWEAYYDYFKKIDGWKIGRNKKLSYISILRKAITTGDY